ncbi:hypothetical protein [Streptomyces sp. NPDC048643]|uniref:hypothetical protein n=1 Tax=Streptomyces sp. NPDC048643 TaxID=3155637 RepID=UPI00344387F4
MPPRKRTDLEAQRDTAGSDSEDSNASTSSVTTVPIVATTINGDGQPEALPIVVGAPDTMPELPEPLHPEREHAIYFEPGDLVPPQFLAQGMSGQIYNYSQATGAWLKAKAEPILSFAAKALPLATTVAATFTEGATSTNLQKASTYLAAAEAATNVGVTAYKAFTDPNVNRGQAAMSVVGSLASVGGTVMSAQAAVPERTQKQVQQLTTLGSAFIALGSATSYTQRPTQESFLPLTESPSQTASGDSVRQDNSNTSLPTDTYAMNRLPTANSALASSPSVASLQSPGAGSNTHPTARTSALPQPPPKAVTVTKRTGNAP